VGAVSFKNTEEIERYLNAGQPYAKKSLIMAGQNVMLYNDASNINGNSITDTIFTHQYLHTKYIGNTPVVGGYAGFLTGKQVYFAFRDSINDASPDVIRPAQTTATVGNNVGDFAYYYNSHPAIGSADSGAGTTWHGATYDIVFYAFDWADALETNPSEAGVLTSGTTRFLRGALDFLTSYNGTILPVEFVSATGNALSQANQIQWQVAHETDVDHYDVEVSTGGQWQTVGSVSQTGAGSYSFDDANVTDGQSYTYRVEAVNLNGSRVQSSQIEVTRLSGTESFVLGQNYPNPFTSTSGTNISYTVPEAATVTLKVIDMTGRVVRTEFENAAVTAGTHQYPMTAGELASGTYVYQLTAAMASGQTQVMTRKMTLDK